MTNKSNRSEWQHEWQRNSVLLYKHDSAKFARPTPRGFASQVFEICPITGALQPRDRLIIWVCSVGIALILLLEWLL